MARQSDLLADCMAGGGRTLKMPGDCALQQHVRNGFVSSQHGGKTKRLHWKCQLAACLLLTVVMVVSTTDWSRIYGCRAFFTLPMFPFTDNSAEKEALLSLITGTDRGAAEPPGRRAEILKAFEALEQRNPTGAPVESSLLKGDRELLWRSSESILGSNRPPFLRPKLDKPILQFLDAAEGVARNLEETPLGCNTVEAEISPLTVANREKFSSRLDNYLFFKYNAEERAGGTYLPEATEQLQRTTVGVRFKVFNILGLFSLPAPEPATGILEVTYLDEDLRLSRGDRGNLFVLRKCSAERSF
eukprot:TRINITY_DN41320_c0_g1_i1.p1 TRINITY_DN41320_c0_g1~~TRINITY_DN41320_c0_g1_i1.p1  ORF type:complete len:302 (-),score=35.82 TRINITY_DN41320_c0_g1_i1:234-1139(-)